MEFTWPTEAADAFARVVASTENWPVADENLSGRELWDACAELGLLGLSVPQEYGGQGHGFVTTARAAEGFGLGCRDFGLVFSVLAHLFACAMPIAEFAGPAVRRRVLPELCSGRWRGANAITEDSAGSDATAVRASAVREGDAYLLNGAKTFVSNGPGADVFVIYARTDDTAGHLGLSAFVVERGTPGLQVGEAFEKTGLRSCPASGLTLRDCRVPAGARLGREGQGAAIFQAAMRWERTCLFAAYLGQMTRVVDRCVQQARSRRQFGRRIGANQAVSHRLARLQLGVEAARLLLYRACWLLDRGEPATSEIAMAKLAVSESAVETSLAAVHLFGGAGVRVDDGIELELRNALPSTIFSGTSEMQLEQIAAGMRL
ncbi:acyl-CoA dehydrogenase family protein [Nonomuraea sp. SBT364]|uniref:acyl-CoA dehydrogenase family protein n=1 Tax=Nonomuraea sp. SBT364 TaxID=1580530 RepID=UPI00066EF737|nr:acyl-CoA dehydrogenase family protein [Nonomuraea sp. SBT364]